MRLKELVDDGVDVFVLEDDIDLHFAPVLRALLQGKIKLRCAALILDLAAVDFIDSSGLAAIIEYYRDAAEYGGVLCLAGTNDTLRSIFQMCRMDTLISLFASAAEAREALRTGTAKRPDASLVAKPAT